MHSCFFQRNGHIPPPPDFYAKCAIWDLVRNPELFNHLTTKFMILLPSFSFLLCFLSVYHFHWCEDWNIIYLFLSKKLKKNILHMKWWKASLHIRVQVNNLTENEANDTLLSQSLNLLKSNSVSLGQYLLLTERAKSYIWLCTNPETRQRILFC